MKKTIMLSLVVTSLVMGANTVNDLTIDQKSKIDSTTITGATVHQGKTVVSDNSDVDDVKIRQEAGDGNLIDNSSISGKYNGTDESVLQGFVKIHNSQAKELSLTSKNTIQNVEVLNSLIEQGSFILTDSNATKTASGTNIQLNSINIVQDSTVDTSIDINATEIKQGVTLLSTSSEVKNVDLQHMNIITGSEIESSKVHQAFLKVDDSQVDDLEVKGLGGGDNQNSLLTSRIEANSLVEQSVIDINTDSIVKRLDSYTKNTIENFKAEDSNITQSKITIHDSHVSDLLTKLENTIEGTIVTGTTYTGWSKTSTISQGETTIN